MKTALAIRALLSSAMLASFTLALAQEPASQQPPADNTKINQRDKNPSEPTADQQKNAPNDRELTRQIRKALVDDKSLSTYAHNIKVVVQNGQVTLKGPVRSEDEKKSAEAAATAVAGTGKVTNELEIAPQK
jgi:hyperosmotically inducible periplasmic protein